MSNSEILIILLNLLSLKLANISCYKFHTATQLVSQAAHNQFPTCSLICIWATFPNYTSNPGLLLKDSLNSFLTMNMLTVNLSIRTTAAATRKFTTSCKLVVTFVPHGDIHFSMSSFLNILSPLQQPITKRHLDHYIFVSTTSTSKSKRDAELFLSNNLTRYEIRYKIYIASDHLMLPSAYTICIFCPGVQVIPFGSSILFPDFTKNLYHFRLRVVGPTSYTSVFELNRILNEYVMKRGLYTVIFQIIEHRLNFTHTFHPCYAFGSIKAGKTGTLLDNGTWVGCVGDLLARRADFAIATSAVDQDRFQVVEYLVPICYNYIMFFTQKPQLAYTWRKVVQVFDVFTWLLVIFLTAAVSLAFYLFEPGSKRFSLLCFHFFGNLVGQPLFSIHPHRLSSKITYVTWLYYAIVVGTAYSCVLKALIAFPGRFPIPTTISSLVQSSPYWKWGASTDFRSGIGEEVFKKSSNPMIRALFHDLSNDNTIEDCLRRAAFSNYACFHWDVMARFTMETEFVGRRGVKYPFVYAKDNVMFLPRSWSTRKGEIYQDGINHVSENSFDSGLWLGILARDAAKARSEMLDEVDKGLRKPLLGTQISKIASMTALDDNTPKPLRFVQVKACLVVWGAGCTVAFQLLLVEMIWHACKKTRKDNTLVFLV